MSDHVKYLPPAAIPAGGVADWLLPEAERWRKARTPAVFAPAATVWVLAPLVLLSAILSGWNAPEDYRGTIWDGYGPAVLLFALPLWYRFLPGATVVSAAVLACLGVLSLDSPEFPPDDAVGRAGIWLLIALAAWAGTGAVLRLRARGRQRAIALAVAGEARHPLPADLPDAHRERGLIPVVVGAGLCLAAAALLVWALAEDVGAARESSYDASGQQVLALLLLLPGTTLLGRGTTARIAARRLHGSPQPVLRVGVRTRTSGRAWIYPDARSTGARPLLSYAARFENGHTRGNGTLLLGASEDDLRRKHHDIDSDSEPYEALLYGLPYEGAELVLEHAEFAYSGTQLRSRSTAAPARDLYGGHPHRWSPAGTSYVLRRREQDKRNREREAERRASSSGSGSSSGCGGSSGCGSSCGSSCGGGCGGGD